MPCPHPLCPSKSSPSLQALSLISGPKGQAQMLAGGLGVPPFPAYVLPSCKSMGMSHQASASCSREATWLLCPQPWGGEMKYRQSNHSVVALIPPHCSQALGREGIHVDWNKHTGSPGIAGGGVTLQRYESALPHFHHQCTGSFLDNRVIRKRIEHTFSLNLSRRWHLWGTICLPRQVPPAQGIFAEPSALSWNGGV